MKLPGWPASSHMQSNRAPRVLITRPQGQHDDFASQCAALGFQVELLPCMEIVPIDVNTDHLKSLLTERRIVLFTSTNAVRCIHQCLPLPWTGVMVHAIGAATAKALDAYGQHIALAPAPPFNSESYLAQLAEQMPESLLIVKGVGGRKLIREQLHGLGWHIDTLDVYERRLPLLQPQMVDAVFVPSPPDVVSVTSNEILRNLWHLGKSHRDTLRALQLVCNSKRCAQLAVELGFSTNTLIAEPAGNTGQVACLEQWLGAGPRIS